jgi:hypothetical protein
MQTDVYFKIKDKKTKNFTFLGLMGGTGFWTFLRMSIFQKGRMGL